MTDPAGGDLVAWVRGEVEAERRLALKAKSMRYELPTDAPWERERIVADRVGGASAAVAVCRVIGLFADLDRVLAEVDVKLAVLDLHDDLVARQAANSARFVELSRQRVPDDLALANVKTHGWELAGRLDALRAVIVLLAGPYAGREGCPPHGSTLVRGAAGPVLG